MDRHPLWVGRSLYVFPLDLLISTLMWDSAGSSVEINKSSGNTYKLRPTHKGCRSMGNGGSYQAGKISVDSDAAKTPKMKEFILNWYKNKGVDLPKSVADRFEVLVLCPQNVVQHDSLHFCLVEASVLAIYTSTPHWPVWPHPRHLSWEGT